MLEPKILTIMLLQPALFMVHADSVANPITIQLEITNKTIEARSDKNIPKLSTLTRPLYKSMEPFGLIKSSNGRPQIIVKLQQETWTDSDGYIFNKISGATTSKKGVVLNTLRHISVSLPKTDEQAYLFNVSKKMILDLVKLSHFNTIDNSASINQGENPAQTKDDNLICYPQYTPQRINSKIKFQPKEPVYLRLARATHISDIILIDVIIDPSGTPLTASLLEGHIENNKLLVENSLVYALNWRFEPFLETGKPIWTHYILRLNFHA